MRVKTGGRLAVLAAGAVWVFNYPVFSFVLLFSGKTAQHDCNVVDGAVKPQLDQSTS